MKLLTLIAGLLFSGLVMGQSHGSISGHITDLEMNGDFSFAQVALKNTSRQTRTNLHGNFELDGVTIGEYTLAISFPGYETLEIPVEVEKNGTVEIQRGLSAKSLDIQTVATSVSGKAEDEALVRSRGE